MAKVKTKKGEVVFSNQRKKIPADIRLKMFNGGTVELEDEQMVGLSDGFEIISKASSGKSSKSKKEDKKSEE